jgi:hypothetical protein
MPKGITLAPLRQRGLSPFNPFECLLQDPFGLRLAALLVPTAEQVSENCFLYPRTEVKIALATARLRLIPAANSTNIRCA